MGSYCGRSVESIPANRKPPRSAPAQKRLNPLKAEHRRLDIDKNTSNSALNSDDESQPTNSETSAATSATPSEGSSDGSGCSSNQSDAAATFDSTDIFSVESDPQARAQRAAESFLQWKDKEYVPLSSEERRAIKEYRKSMAMEEGTYMSTRAQRPRPDAPRREMTREGDYIPLDDPAESHVLKRRNSQIRFTEAVALPAAPDVHNDILLVPLDDGAAVPALKPTASILSKASMTDVVDEVPLYGETDLFENTEPDPAPL